VGDAPTVLVNGGATTLRCVERLPELSGREHQVLESFMAGEPSVKKVASELWISQETVEFHLRNIISKLLAR
jgi:FixJ family two-component response regulator